jgi:FdhE protein
MTRSVNAAVLDLQRQYPDWQPWLTIVDEVLRQATQSQWDSLVPETPQRRSKNSPLLADVTLAVDLGAIEQWSDRLMHMAARSGAPNMTAFDRIGQGCFNPADLFKSSLCQNDIWLRAAADAVGVDAAAFQAVALLVAVPFLQACNRRGPASMTENWTEGYCPLCGAWPAYAEVRGIERSRYLRCGRCGRGWQTQCLFCSYCGMTDHNELVSFVPEKSVANGIIDGCKRCHGYVKVFTTLQGSSAPSVMIKDLASVDLDIAAIEQGYRRPAGAGYPLNIDIVAKPRLGARILRWQG